MLETLISSKTRLKILLKFFLNSDTRAYLRGLESEFRESATAIRSELNSLEKAGMLVSESEGNKKFFRANVEHPLYEQLHQIVLKQVGIDQIISNVTKRLGNLEMVYLTGSFSRGLDGPIVDLLLIGDIDKIYLVGLIEKVEKLINRKIRYLVYQRAEFENLSATSFQSTPVLLWSTDDEKPVK